VIPRSTKTQTRMSIRSMVGGSVAGGYFAVRRFLLMGDSGLVGRTGLRAINA
jgi:hypothetical protein